MKIDDCIPAKDFKWRMNGGEFIAPRDMKTSHLFYTLRMIWNHVVPHDKRLTPYKNYKFASVYTAEYMREAVTMLTQELSGRSELTERMIRDLEWIYVFSGENRNA